MIHSNLTKARAALVLDQPFFAALLFGLPMIEDKGIATLATNGDEIRYNPDFVGKLSVSETVFVLAHETMHCVLQHMYRRGSRDARRWNIAADYVINGQLVAEKVGVMPKGCLLDDTLVKQGNGTAEGVYGLLPEQPPQGKPDKGKGKDGTGKPEQGDGYPGPGEPGGPLDDVHDASADHATASQKEAEMRVKIIQAANAAKMCGKLSASMARMVGEMTATRVDWKSVLRRFLTERAKTDLSYARPKRRFLADDICLPSLTGEKLGTIVVAVDCSGSVDDKLLAAFGAEIRAICEDTRPARVEILYFDSKVLRRDSFGPDDTVELKPTGGGGTAFSPIFEYIEQHDLAPVACVVLTDLCCSDFGPQPGYPVLWASTEAGQAPFGEVLNIGRESYE